MQVYETWTSCRRILLRRHPRPHPSSCLCDPSNPYRCSLLWHVGGDEVCGGLLVESPLAREKEEDYYPPTGWLKAEEEEGEAEGGGWHWLLQLLLSAVLHAPGLVLPSGPFLPART